MYPCVLHRTYRRNASADTAWSASLHQSRRRRCGPIPVCRAGASNNHQGTIMAITPNKDQVKGELKDLGGKIQEEAGKLVGDKAQQAKGLKRQAQGKLQKTVGDLKEIVTDAVTKA